jgi:uncharacterized protein (TIGR03435 family)
VEAKAEASDIVGGRMNHFRSSHLAWSICASLLLASVLTGNGLFMWADVEVQTTVEPSVKPPKDYEIVSIKPDKGTQGGSMEGLPNGFRDTGIDLATIVREAYGIVGENQIVGMPTWAESDAYDVEARVDSETSEAWKKLTAKERRRQEQPLLQALLADRCQLKVHRDTKELPVYDMVIAKGGLKMKGAAPEEHISEQLSGGRLTANAMGTDDLADIFSGTDGRLIVDKTGLGERKFDFELTWAPDFRRALDDGPSLFTALEEQLGLKLVRSRGPVNILVIDHMEKPSPN